MIGFHYALQYFPDDFNEVWTHIIENELKNSDEQTRKWYTDYLDLMEYRRNPNYGRTKCFHCLRSPDGDDPIFIGINRLVAKGLEENKNNPIPYPCHVVNRFECPYDYEKEKISNTKFDVEDLFELAREMFDMVLEQGLDYILSDKETFSDLSRFEHLQKDNRDKIVDYFMNIKDKIKLDELRFG